MKSSGTAFNPNCASVILKSKMFSFHWDVAILTHLLYLSFQIESGLALHDRSKYMPKTDYPTCSRWRSSTWSKLNLTLASSRSAACFYAEQKNWALTSPNQPSPNSGTCLRALFRYPWLTFYFEEAEYKSVSDNWLSYCLLPVRKIP